MDVKYRSIKVLNVDRKFVKYHLFLFCSLIGPQMFKQIEEFWVFRSSFDLIQISTYTNFNFNFKFQPTFLRWASCLQCGCLLELVATKA